ncbi:MAG: tRNA uridine-5-carboxymethylaminomethyl(34) synthesis GTPase MnmE, partial [Desulfovibrionales bacterium]
MRNDTIAAVATPPGRGGVGIVRVSGPDARRLVTRMFRASGRSFTGFVPYRLHHGWITDLTGEDIDEALVSFMPGPGSFTGEDVMEINCHGGPAILRMVMDNVTAGGARPAEPGEFTFRAYLNGKLDLTQAEAIVEMINASGETALGLARQKLKGVLGQRVSSLRNLLEELRVALCLAVDFPEEEVECLSPAEFASRIAEIRAALNALLANYERARVWREGALVVISGRVNAGKSSLLNAVLGRERAIVTDIPGTTRDFLEESVDLDGLPVRLVDTAGLRESMDAVEQMGLVLGREMMDRADLVLLVHDGALPLGPDETALLRDVGERALLVWNKCDLPVNPDPAPNLQSSGVDVHRISAKTGQGLEALLSAVRRRLVSDEAKPDHSMIAPNLRQRRILEQALEEILLLEGDLASQTPYDLLGVRLETACTIL